MDPTPTGILPETVTFEGAEGSSKAPKGTQKKKQVAKPKAGMEEVIKQIVLTKSGKVVLKKTKKKVFDK